MLPISFHVVYIGIHLNSTTFPSVVNISTLLWNSFTSCKNIIHDNFLLTTFPNVRTYLSMPWKVWTTRDCTSIAYHIIVKLSDQIIQFDGANHYQMENTNKLPRWFHKCPPCCMIAVQWLNLMVNLLLSLRNPPKIKMMVEWVV